MRRSVDVIIAAHSPRRPVGRAVRSVLEGNGDVANAVVVCHNQARTAIEEAILPGDHERVDWLELHDRTPSPSGPFNYGMSRSSADFVSIVGSDDQLDPGAVRHWLQLADRHDADAVITRLVRGPQRNLVRSPPVRPFRWGVADPVRDRLAYRTAPLGLVSRSAIDRLGLRLTPGARNGGDLEFSLRLWFDGRVVVSGRGPSYVEHGDADDRVTFAKKPVWEELQTVRDLLRSQWFLGRSSAERHSICVKLVRRHLFGTIHKRPDEATWTPEERLVLREVAKDLLRLGAGVEDVLSLAEWSLLEAVLDTSVPARVLLKRYGITRKTRTPSAVLTRRPSTSLARQAPLRYMAASVLLR